MNCLRSFRCLPSFLISAPKPPALNLIRPLHSSSFLRSFDMETVHTTDRLRELRALMKKHEVDIYSTHPLTPIGRALAHNCLVVPSEDSHQSEYIAPCDARRGPSTLLGLMPATVDTTTRVYNRLLGICRYCSNHTRQSIARHGWTLFQPGQQTTRRQLGIAQARSTGRSYVAGMVGFDLSVD